MGYEIRLHILIVFSFPIDKENNIKGGSEIAVVDLCKCGNDKFSKYVAEMKKEAEKNPEIRAGFFATDGDTIITKDKYDSWLPMLDPAKCLEYLEEGFEESKKEYEDKCGYRRYELAIFMLEVIVERFPEKHITVLPFGH